MSRNHIINSNSVQSQFALLLRDKDNLHKQSTNAENERRYEESKLQNLRSIQSSLSEKIRFAHANLGVQSKKKQMLNTEILRLKKVLEDDRSSIEELTSKVEKLEREIIEKKFQFVKEMDSLNDELVDALRMYEEKGLETILKSVGSCRIIEQFLREKMQHPDFTQDQHWNNLFYSISNTIGRFDQNMKYLENEKEKYSSLCGKTQQLRKIVETKYSKSLTEVELDELESLWEQNNSDGDCKSGQTDSTQQHPINMHLFYGNELNGGTSSEQNEHSGGSRQHYEDMGTMSVENFIEARELQ